MKTRYEIEMDFKAAMEAASELRRIAGEMQGISDDDMSGTLNGIRANWQGENAEQYLQKGEIVRGRIGNTAGSILRIAETIETIAENTRKAELKAIEIASTTSRGGSGAFGGGVGGGGFR